MTNCLHVNIMIAEQSNLLSTLIPWSPLVPGAPYTQINNNCHDLNHLHLRTRTSDKLNSHMHIFPLLSMFYF